MMNASRRGVYACGMCLIHGQKYRQGATFYEDHALHYAVFGIDKTGVRIETIVPRRHNQILVRAAGNHLEYR